MRTAEIKRSTNETKIVAKLTIEGSGKYEIATSCGFLNHMLELFARHGRFDLSLAAKGDTEVDFHHTVEDVGIVLGQAFFKALGEKRGISRYGTSFVPMDEALVRCCIDISGRSTVVYGLDIPTQRVGSFDTELTEEFFRGFCRACPITLHLKKEEGTNSHHIIEAAFKAFARALKQACEIDEALEGEIPSTKGSL